MESTFSNEQKKKSNFGLVVLIIVIIGTMLYYFGFFSPRGVIVADQADDSSSRLGDYSYRITASILNEGKSGEITLTASLKQGGNYWKKDLTKYIKSNQVETFVIEFDEATLLGGQASYTLNCSP